MKATLIGGAPSESLCVCLGRLESHMTTCGGGFLVQERLSLADVVIWAALYALLAPESTASSGERERERGRERERERWRERGKEGEKVAKLPVEEG